jgi:hypothetical protein
VTIISTLLIVSGAIDAATGLVVFGVAGSEVPANFAGNHGIIGVTFFGFSITCFVVSYGFRWLRSWAWTPASYTSALNLFVAFVAFNWPGLVPVAIGSVLVSIATVVAMFRPGVAGLFRPRPR